MVIGLGYYQAATFQRLGLGLYLCHLCPEVAEAVRQDEPWAVIVGRFDPGRDAEQVDFGSPNPEAEADRFFEGRIAPVVGRYPGVYTVALGINESWPSPPRREPGEPDAAYEARRARYREALEWRSAFELRLCRRVQAELRLAYGWGAISVGCLEPEDLGLFAGVIREAFCTVYHAYLPPGALRVEDDQGPWYIYRPTRLWLPELRRLGLPLRLLVSECGPYRPDLRGRELAGLQVEIGRALEAECARDRVEYLGAIAYGQGLLGDQAPWELRGAENVFVEAKPATEVTLMGLREQFPDAFREWEAAGGVESNFEAFLVGTGRLPVTRENALRVLDRLQSALNEVRGVVSRLPFDR